MSIEKTGAKPGTMIAPSEAGASSRPYKKSAL